MVLVLRGDERREALVARALLGLPDLRGGEIGAADVAHLALPHEIVQCPQRLLDRRVRIGTMEIGDVHPLGLEPLEARPRPPARLPPPPPPPAPPSPPPPAPVPPPP